MLRLVQAPCYTIRTLDAIDEPDAVSDRAWLIITETVAFAWKDLFGTGRLPHLFITVIGAPMLGRPPDTTDSNGVPFAYNDLEAAAAEATGGLACCAVGMHMINIATGESLMCDAIGSSAISMAAWIRALIVSTLYTVVMYKQEVDGDRRWTEDWSKMDDSALDEEVSVVAERLLEKWLAAKEFKFGTN